MPEDPIIELAKMLRTVHDASAESDKAIMELVTRLIERFVTLERLTMELASRVVKLETKAKRSIH